VLIAPFVIYAGARYRDLRCAASLPPPRRLRSRFSRPPIAELSLYVLILALLIVLF